MNEGIHIPWPPRNFGQHPLLPSNKKSRLRCARKSKDPTKIYEALMGERVPLKNFFNPLHPTLYLIPADQYITVVDEWDEAIGFEQTHLPFSSSSFFLDREKGVFAELNTEPFWRLGGISQLGYLVPPYPHKIMGKNISFLVPAFPHTRWLHSILTGALAEVILARNGFSEKDRAPIVLTMAYHDIATPAGGESGKRVDIGELDEEKNFGWVLTHYGLDKRWENLYNFNLAEAEKWIKNEGTFGHLLDIIDKMSYTTIDCYYFGSCYPSEVRKYCLKHPLFIDVWEDIRFINEQEFAFTNPNRLFAFLMARALGHQELYQNPAARILDFFLTKLIQPLYQQGIITKENLLLWTTQQLEFELPKHYPPDKEVRPTYVTPGEYQWRWFPSEEELQDFCQKQKVDHTEHLKGFDSGLDWPVFSDKIHSQIVPLAEVLDREQISQLTEIVNSTIGYYAYWHTPDEQPLNF